MCSLLAKTEPLLSRFFLENHISREFLQDPLPIRTPADLVPLPCSFNRTYLKAPLMSEKRGARGGGGAGEPPNLGLFACFVVFFLCPFVAENASRPPCTCAGPGQSGH